MKNDLMIIGSGPGGYRAAEYAAHKGLSVTIIEEKHAGGTCLNCGCIPTKTLCRNAEMIDSMKEAATYGIHHEGFSINYASIKERKDSVVSQLRAGVETLMKAPGITFVQGRAVFKDSKTVVVNDEEYTADNIFIATGSYAKMLPIEGIQHPSVITSTELLDIKQVPKKLCIIGAGVIGMEMASVFNSFGSEVTVIEFLKECLPVLDSDIAKRLRQTISKRGVNFIMQSGVKRILHPEGEGAKSIVVYERKGKEEQVEADVVLVATGRGANVDGMGLENTGIEYSPKGIPVDDNMQTNVPGIYAIGDVNARCMLAHAATFQGIHAVNHILNITDNIRLDIMPSAIFTYPEAASVGLSEDQCKQQGIDYTCKKGYYRANGKALAMNETDGLLKLIADSEGKIIGCHAYGAHAADMIQEASALMCRETTVQQLAEMVHIHPTLGEILVDTAMTAV
ncbi:MAG: dihydrolipoyl dehydrogenase [Prevotella sp.]|nr:dihydrolipoyl dehydrogenase [Prevotella sp.]